MTSAVHRQPNSTSVPVVICIADEPRERARLAGRFDGAGVMVLASDLESAQSFLGTIQPGAPEPPVEHSQRVVRVDGLRLNLAHHLATWHDRPLQLTPHELKVLGCLASSPGRLWTYQQLHDDAWDDAYFTGPAAVQSVVKRLRAKLRGSSLPLHIEAARGVGFRLTVGTDLHLVPPVQSPT
ncbi:MAG TPA: winged helix-turn-helix domain-containing protein [Nocardioidaceae bacterium]|nr:winged helix-turn-helix domain-containing protein [Nocardioidaceae bacterium]